MSRYTALLNVFHAAAVSYAKRVIAHAPHISLAPLHCAMLRLAAERLRRTGEEGADFWASRLEQMAREEPVVIEEDDDG